MSQRGPLVRRSSGGAHDERSRLFVRDIEPDPGWEVRVIDPGEEVAIEPGTWEEYVPASQIAEAERDWCERILHADQRADERVLATLAQAAAARLTEMEGR